MRRLVDPIHFFDHHGRSLMSLAHVNDRCEELEAENQELRRKLHRALLRIRSLTTTEDEDFDAAK